MRSARIRIAATARSLANALIVAVVLLTPATPASAAEPAPLAGTSWRFVELAGHGSGMAGDITFEEQSFRGATACNFVGGTYRLAGAGGLTFEVGRMTRRACFGEALELEAAYLEALKNATTVDRSGETMSLVDATGTRLARLVLRPPVSVEGPRLKITSYLHEGGLYSAAPDRLAWLRLGPGGTLEGQTGCTALTGTWRREPGNLALTVSNEVRGDAPCDGPLARQDASIRAVLQTVAGDDSERNLIRFLDANGSALLWLTPATEEE